MSGVVPLNLVKSVVDPIHGLIRMTREEHDLMNSRVFQRLRGIKQNGLLHLVFPSATHTRFEHSLGVMFVADAILQALYFNSEAERNKGLSKVSTATWIRGRSAARRPGDLATIVSVRCP